ncbi:MAG TPA: histidine phosphotransferase family protein [Alphaproteobacteria bacterium]|nr:histidine phosphotransferase family protein [Alphaproteobacteria bacterium]
MDVLIDLKVAELLCSRLCHELINPVGAVSNGVELIAEFEDEPDREALALIAQSARSAARRLQFYRVAYGLAAGVNTNLTLAEIGGLAEGVLEGARLRLEWPREGREAEWRPSRDGLKLLLNLIVLASEALPRGGRVEVMAVQRAEQMEIIVKAAGEQAGLGDEASRAFRGEARIEELTARTAHAYFTGRLSARGELSVAIAESAESIAFRLALPARS